MSSPFPANPSAAPAARSPSTGWPWAMRSTAIVRDEACPSGRAAGSSRDGEVFLMNRRSENSFDGRYFGPLPPRQSSAGRSPLDRKGLIVPVSFRQRAARLKAIRARLLPLPGLVSGRPARPTVRLTAGRRLSLCGIGQSCCSGPPVSRTPSRTLHILPVLLHQRTSSQASWKRHRSDSRFRHPGFEPSCRRKVVAWCAPCRPKAPWA